MTYHHTESSLAPWAVTLAFAVLGCDSSGTSGVPFDSVAVGTWSASGGGIVTFAADGTGETNATYLLEKACTDPVPFVWRFDPAPDDAAPGSAASYDGFAFGKRSASGCPGNLDIGHSFLSVEADKFVLGNVSVDPPVARETFVRQSGSTSACTLSEWETWSTCSETCGGGTQTRTRTVVSGPADGAGCGALEERRACNTDACVATARTARVVHYATGAFVQLPDMSWVENDTNGSRAYTETRRGDDAVDLASQDGTVTVVLGVEAGRIDYTDTQTNAVTSQTIVETNPDRTNGWSTSVVEFATGRFEQTSVDTWTATGIGTAELGLGRMRDQWSVYLLSDDPMFDVILDMFTQEITVVDHAANMTTMHAITAAR